MSQNVSRHVHAEFLHFIYSILSYCKCTLYCYFKKKKLVTNVTLFTMSKYFQRQFINGGKKVAIL